MSELTTDISWLSVISGFVLSFLLGWAWFSTKMFGTKWAEGVGAKLNDVNQMSTSAMGLQAIGTFLLSWFVGVMAAHSYLSTTILVTLTFMALNAGAGKFSHKSNYAICTEILFLPAMVIIMIICEHVFANR